MEKYVCKVCGYTYDAAVGDSSSGIEPGVPFATLSDDWVCPQCGAEKTEFEEENETMPGMVIPIGE